MTAASVALASLLCGGFNAATTGVLALGVTPGWCALTLGDRSPDRGGRIARNWAGAAGGSGTVEKYASLLPCLCRQRVAARSVCRPPARGSFRHWSLLLAILTLTSSLLGTLIVRSGILPLVHAFALDSDARSAAIYPFAALSLASLALCTAGGRGPYPATRLERQAQAAHSGDAAAHSAVLLIVCWSGRSYPMIYGLMGWGRLSVGAPYFNRVTLCRLAADATGDYRAGDVRSRKSRCIVSFRRCWRIWAYLSSPPGSWFPAAVGMKSALTSAPVSRVVLAGYTALFRASLDLEAKAATSEKRGSRCGGMKTHWRPAA